MDPFSQARVVQLRLLVTSPVLTTIHLMPVLFFVISSKTCDTTLIEVDNGAPALV